MIIQGTQAGLNKNGDMLDTINEYSTYFRKLGLDSSEMFNMLANGSEDVYKRQILWNMNPL